MKKLKKMYKLTNLNNSKTLMKFQMLILKTQSHKQIMKGSQAYPDEYGAEVIKSYSVGRGMNMRFGIDKKEHRRELGISNWR